MRILQSVLLLIAFYLLVLAFIRGAFQYIALIRLGNLYLGIIGAGLAIMWLWALAGFAPMLYASYLRAAPEVWSDRQTGFRAGLLGSIVFLVVYYALAESASFGVTSLIAWLADMRCEEALRAGVTGSRLC